MKKLLIPFSLFLLLLSTACIDEKYDKDIDLNLQLAENGLTIPIGSTKQLKLSDLIEEGDNLQTDKDHVYFITDTTITSSNFDTMQAFDIAGPGLNPVMYTDIPVSDIPGGVEVENLQVPIKLSVSRDITAFTEGISKDISSIEAVWFNADQTEYVNLAFRVESLKSGTLSMKAENLVVKFPKMLVFSDENPGSVELGEGLKIEDWTLTIPERYSNADGVLELPRIPIVGIRGRDGDTEFLHVIKETGGEYHNLEVLNNTFEIIEGNIVLTLNGNIEFSAPAQIATEFSIQTLEVYRIEGIIEEEVDTYFSLEMGSLPDFLDNDDIELDLTNPYIVLEALNPMGVPVKTVLAFSSEHASVKTDEIFITGAVYDEASGVMIPATNNIYIAKAPRNDMGDYTYVYGDLAQLLDEGIPSALDVTVTAITVTDEIHTILLGEYSNEVSVTSIINVPLEFGAGLHINYSDIEGGLEDTFKDLSFEEAGIKIAYTSTLPLTVEFSLIPLQEIEKSEYDRLPDNKRIGDIDEEDEEFSAYYKILEDVIVEIAGKIAGTGDETHPATGNLEAKLGEKTPGAMNALTHIKWMVDGDAAAAEGALKDTQYLQLDLKASIKKIQVNVDSL